MSSPADTPLTVAVAVQSWRLDAAAVLLVVVLGVGYARCPRMGRGPTSCFVAGLIVWVLATSSVIAVYAPVLFWMRALQVLMSLFVVPFLLALGRPVSAVRAALAGTGRARLDRLLASPRADWRSPR